MKNTLYGHNVSIYSMIELNNNDLVSGSCDSTIKIWNTNDWSVKFTFNFTIGCISGLVQLKNGNLVTLNTNTFMIIINPFKGSLIQKLILQIVLGTMIQLSNEDLSIGNIISQVRIYDSVIVKPKNTLVGHLLDIQRIVQLDNNDLVSSSWDNTTRIWDWNTKSLNYNLTGHTELT